MDVEIFIAKHSQPQKMILSGIRPLDGVSGRVQRNEKLLEVCTPLKTILDLIEVTIVLSRETYIRFQPKL